VAVGPATAQVLVGDSAAIQIQVLAHVSASFASQGPTTNGVGARIAKATSVPAPA